MTSAELMSARARESQKANFLATCRTPRRFGHSKNTEKFPLEPYVHEMRIDGFT